MMITALHTGFLGTALLLAGPVFGLPAQVTRVERHAYARFEALRTELLVGCLRSDAPLRGELATILAAAGYPHPFDRLAHALAALRGVEPDDPFRYRAGILPLVLPHVADPDVLATVHATSHAPRIVPDLPDVRFVVTLEDAAGDVRARVPIAGPTDREAVLRFRASTPLGLEGLEDGPYRVSVGTSFGDGGAPRPGDVDAVARISVLRGFKARAETLPIAGQLADRAATVAALLGELAESRRDRLSRAILFGACWPVERAFLGEPRLGGEDPVVALAHAEAVFANLRAGRPALAGLQGRVTIGLPGATRDDGVDEIVLASVALPAGDDTAPRPLCVFVPGVPCWNLRGDRPISPDTLEPMWLVERLRAVGFDAEDRLHVVVLESPGRFANPSATLRAATAALRGLLEVGDRPTLWIGEREAGYVASRALLEEPGSVRGLVLVAGVGLSQRDVEALEPTISVLAITAQAHPTTAFLQRVAAGIGDAGRFAVTAPEGVPWSLALPLRAAEIESFALRVAGCGD